VERIKIKIKIKIKQTGLSWEPHQTVQLLEAAIDFQVEEVYILIVD
jgi:hypothetical protein